jgi:hypothetical protein
VIIKLAQTQEEFDRQAESALLVEGIEVTHDNLRTYGQYVQMMLKHDCDTLDTEAFALNYRAAKAKFLAFNLIQSTKTPAPKDTDAQDPNQTDPGAP